MLIQFLNINKYTEVPHWGVFTGLYWVPHWAVFIRLYWRTSLSCIHQTLLRCSLSCIHWSLLRCLTELYSPVMEVVDHVHSSHVKFVAYVHCQGCKWHNSTSSVLVVYSMMRIDSEMSRCGMRIKCRWKVKGHWRLTVKRRWWVREKCNWEMIVKCCWGVSKICGWGVRIKWHCWEWNVEDWEWHIFLEWE